MQRKLPEVEVMLMRIGDPVDLFMKWRNYEWPHMSLNYDERETSWQVFQRKMHPAGTIVVGEQTKEEYG